MSGERQPAVVVVATRWVLRCVAAVILLYVGFLGGVSFCGCLP